MRRSVTATALWLTLLLLVSGSPALPSEIQIRPAGGRVVQSATMTNAALPNPLVAPGDLHLNTHPWRTGASRVTSTTAGGELPAELLDAYALAVAAAPPSCHLSVSVLAAIGQVESENLAGHVLDARQRVTPAILGPALDGTRSGGIKDTDNGQMDGDKQWDRALGPMQLIPSSWRVVRVDMDGDGARDPQNIYDAAGAAMVYLCAGGRDLAYAEQLRDAVLDYNHSDAYVELVLGWKLEFDRQALTEPTLHPSVDLWGVTVAQLGLSDTLAAVAARSRVTVGSTIPATAHPASPAPGAVATTGIDAPPGAGTAGAGSMPSPAVSEPPDPPGAHLPAASSPGASSVPLPSPGPSASAGPQTSGGGTPADTTPPTEAGAPASPPAPAPAPAPPNEPTTECLGPLVAPAPDPVVPPQQAVEGLDPCLVQSLVDPAQSLTAASP